jgi:hypothetical protein
VVHPDVLLAAGGAEDSFAEVRKVQASAGQYPTSDAYYDALNSAIARWRSKRQGDLGAPPSKTHARTHTHTHTHEESGKVI